MAELTRISSTRMKDWRLQHCLVVTIVMTVVTTIGCFSGARTPVVKMKLPKSIPPNPDFLAANACGTSEANDTYTCNAAIIQAIDNARRTEPVAGIPHRFSLSAFDALNHDEQIFAITDIERTARRLPPIAGLTRQLNLVALSAAEDQRDPSVSLPLPLDGGGDATIYRSNFAEGAANAMGSDYFWMYDDGLDSPNADCTTSHLSGCWAHRENILGPYHSAAYCPHGSKIHMVMGAAEVTTGILYSPAITELFVNDCGAKPTVDFTWSDVETLVLGERVPARHQDT